MLAKTNMLVITRGGYVREYKKKLPSVSFCITAVRATAHRTSHSTHVSIGGPTKHSYHRMKITDCCVESENSHLAVRPRSRHFTLVNKACRAFVPFVQCSSVVFTPQACPLRLCAPVDSWKPGIGTQPRSLWATYRSTAVTSLIAGNWEYCRGETAQPLGYRILVLQ